MNVVLNPINKSNTKFHLSLSSRYLDLDIQDLQFVYLENDEDLVMCFEMHDQQAPELSEALGSSVSASMNGFVEYSKNHDMVIKIN